MSAVEWTDAEVEAVDDKLAAFTVKVYEDDVDWTAEGFLTDHAREWVVKRALEALAPFVAARAQEAAEDAWDEGYSEGVQRGIGLERTGHLMTRRHELGPVPVNPYRTEAGESL